MKLPHNPIVKVEKPIHKIIRDLSPIPHDDFSFDSSRQLAENYKEEKRFMMEQIRIKD